MELYCEGLKEYLRLKGIENSYFCEVEYYSMYHNRLASFVPVILREEDAEKQLLYDITGMLSLVKAKEENIFTEKECRQVLEQIILLLKNVEEYMLTLNHISFHPDDIYIDTEGNLFWLYQPNQTFQYREELNTLWAWLMEHIDYENRMAVEFAYHVFRSMKKQVLTKDMLERCLGYEVKKGVTYAEFFSEEENVLKANSLHQDGKLSQEGGLSQPDSHEKKDSSAELVSLDLVNPQNAYGDYYRKENAAFDPYAYMIYEDEKEKKEKEAGRDWVYLMLEGLFILLAFGMVGLSGWFIYSGIEQNLLSYYLRYVAGCFVLFLCFIYGFIQSRKAGRVRLQEESVNPKASKKARSKENALPLKSNKVKKEKKDSEGYWERPVGIEQDRAGTTDFYENQDERTTILTARKEKASPEAYLKDLDTGEIFFLHEFPLFIGKDAATCHLVLKDETVSRKHAVITKNQKNGSYFIEDLNSSNGTRVDQDVIVPGVLHPLHIGEQLSISRKEFQLLADHMG